MCVDVERRRQGADERCDGRTVREAVDTLAKLGQAQQRVAQAGEVARPRTGEGDARRDALDVGGMSQDGGELAPRSGGVAQHADRRMPLGRGRLPPQRMGQPFAHQPAAGSARAGVEQREQGGLGLAAQRRHDLQVAPRGGIEAELVARIFVDERTHVLQCRLLRGRRIAEQGARSAEAGVQPVRAEAGEVARSEMPCQCIRRGPGVEMPGR